MKKIEEGERRRRRTRIGFARSMQRNRGQRYKITNSVFFSIGGVKKNAHIYVFIYTYGAMHIRI